MSNAIPTQQSKSVFHFTAGLASGTLSAILLQPIDLLKTRVQQSGTHSLIAVIREIRASPTGVIPGLWRGAVPSALRSGFGSAIYFTSLNAVRGYAARNVPALAVASTASNGGSSTLPKLSHTGNLLTGAAARTFAGMVLMPLTIVKVRYESSLYNYTSIAAAGRDILRTEGVRGFFSGFGATALRDAPYAGLYVLFYEQSKTTLSRLITATSSSSSGGDGSAFATSTKMSSSAAASVNFISGISAGAACSVVSNPFDAVKTRIQLQPGVYRNMWAAARRMVGEEGWRSLLDGLALRMTRKALSSALAWTVYEELVRRAETRTVGKKSV